jgi:hypothetical protein
MKDPKQEKRAEIEDDWLREKDIEFTDFELLGPIIILSA